MKTTFLSKKDHLAIEKSIKSTEAAQRTTGMKIKLIKMMM